jgi:hypothetical protein
VSGDSQVLMAPTSSTLALAGCAYAPWWLALLVAPPASPRPVFDVPPPLPVTRPVLPVRDQRAAMVRPYVHWPRHTTRARRLLVAVRGLNLGVPR